MTRSGARRALQSTSSFEKPQTVPLHEGAQQIDLVRAVDLGAQLRAQVRLATAVRQQGASDNGVDGRTSSTAAITRADRRKSTDSSWLTGLVTLPLASSSVLRSELTMVSLSFRVGGGG